MRNPDAYADHEIERIAPRETPAADPDNLRRLGDDFTNTWVYRDPNSKFTLLEMLKPDFGGTAWTVDFGGAMSSN
jgi:hypothetical protein